jgi:pimeloyl-ACP methyl ester carboxylesterase
MTALGVASPPRGGIDIDVPGNGVKLAATRWPGAGSTPVVLLHGLSSQRRFWNLVVARLDGVPLLAIDQRGHGDSDKPPTDYALSTVASDVATALDALGWSRTIVVGHSWGGAVAATFAAQFAHRSLALVAIDGGFTSPLADGADRAVRRQQMEPPRIAAAPDELVAMFSSRTPVTRWSDDVAAAVLPIFEVGPDGLARPRLPFEQHMQIVDTLLDYDAADVLGRVQCPTWLVSCESASDVVPGSGAVEHNDWLAAKAAALSRVVQARPDARVLRWGGAVHDVPLQWPALVAGLIRVAIEQVG